MQASQQGIRQWRRVAAGATGGRIVGWSADRGRITGEPNQSSATVHVRKLSRRPRQTAFGLLRLDNY